MLIVASEDRERRFSFSCGGFRWVSTVFAPHRLERERTYFPSKHDDLRGLRTLGLVTAIFIGPPALLASALFTAHGSLAGVLISGGVTLLCLSLFLGLTKSSATGDLRYASWNTARLLNMTELLP